MDDYFQENGLLTNPGPSCNRGHPLIYGNIFDFPFKIAKDLVFGDYGVFFPFDEGDLSKTFKGDDELISEQRALWIYHLE
ncbi:hypothetical protein KIM67_16500 [Flagellimonas sp. 389]|uniref:hypothetical protein n=1 Tax=Flagellimonas sp. 389 TaxID=2835862 RepID=UPI001BD635AA|nr:hypothetical protein [Flagellimonas sp. 389]MBS9464024.1 hypothetical protein [Flagellimonas sp. 389]